MAFAYAFDRARVSLLMLTVVLISFRAENMAPARRPAGRELQFNRILRPNQEGKRSMLNDASFMSGVWCGVIFGAAAVIVIVSLIVESTQRKQERRLHRVHEIWQ